MLNIPCPDRNSVEDIDNIISEKNSGVVKTTLQKLLPKIKSRYSDYAQIELNSRIVSDIFSEEEQVSLRNLYSSKTKTAKKIVETISKIQLLTQAGYCVSCGIGEADQIDHFLPQEHFPEYTILHKNLAPICGTCNEIKGDNIPGVAKDYIHPMFDKLPDEPFLSCTINYSDHIPKSQFLLIGKFHNTRVASHFNDFNLGQRLSKKSTQYFVQIMAYKKELGVDFATEEIARDIEKIGVCFGTNYWKYILCKEMTDTNFVDQL